MTREAAEKLTLRKLDYFGITGWRVKFVEHFTSAGLQDKTGYCEVEAKTIWYTRKGMARSENPEIGDDFALNLIDHEVAHALAPQDREHGIVFRFAREQVRGI